MGAKVSAEMKKARLLLAKAVRDGKTVSFGQVARQVGLTCSAVQKDAECQRLLPNGGKHAVIPAMQVAIDIWEAGKGSISKREAARQAGVSNAGLVLAIQRKTQGAKDGENG